MVIFRNIPGIFKVLFSLPGLSTLKKQIDQARASGDTQAEQAAILGATIKWGSYLVKNFHVSIHVEGREHLPKAGPVVYVCNHQGYADIPVLCSVLDQIQFGFIAKDNLKQIPLYGTWMKRIRSVMIKRDDARASLKAISEGIDNINQGFSMLIFPEGTRAKGGPM
ncbi:MAG: lysophospholipid acyltransferase family protein, partial [Anaerovoracaceae bacterium]